MAALRCGVVEYLNALPLWVALKADPRFSITAAVPSRLAQMLHAGEIELGLLPSIEYFRGKDLKIIPGLGVCSLSTVDSVRLYHRVPLEQVRRVRLDTSSRTSAALVQVVLGKFHRIFPEYLTGPVDPTQLETMAEDAALLIGDPALVAHKMSTVPSIDLGREWNRFTGLPFVYAVWLRRKPELDLAGLLGDPSLPGAGMSDKQLQEVLVQALAKGKTLIPQLSKMVAQSKQLGAADLEIYLRSRIKYEMTELEVEGLHTFAVLASEMGLCPRKRLAFAV